MMYHIMKMAVDPLGPNSPFPERAEQPHINVLHGQVTTSTSHVGRRPSQLARCIYTQRCLAISTVSSKEKPSKPP